MLIVLGFTLINNYNLQKMEKKMLVIDFAFVKDQVNLLLPYRADCYWRPSFFSSLVGVDIKIHNLLTGLSGVDLLMADLKALEAYARYFYYLSKVWSKPLPETYNAQDVADYFNCRPHVVVFRLLEVC